MKLIIVEVAGISAGGNAHDARQQILGRKSGCRTIGNIGVLLSWSDLIGNRSCPLVAAAAKGFSGGGQAGAGRVTLPIGADFSDPDSILNPTLDEWLEPKLEFKLEFMLEFMLEERLDFPYEGMSEVVGRLVLRA